MDDGKIDEENENELQTFGALRQAVFKDDNMSVSYHQEEVYQACVLSVVLYGGEYRTSLKRLVRKLDAFHH